MILKNLSILWGALYGALPYFLLALSRMKRRLRVAARARICRISGVARENSPEIYACNAYMAGI